MLIPVIGRAPGSPDTSTPLSPLRSALTPDSTVARSPRSTMPFSVESLTVTSCKRTPCDPASTSPVELRWNVTPVSVPVLPRPKEIAGVPWLSPVGLVPRSVRTLFVASSLPRSETMMYGRPAASGPTACPEVGVHRGDRDVAQLDAAAAGVEERGVVDVGAARELQGLDALDVEQGARREHDGRGEPRGVAVDRHPGRRDRRVERAQGHRAAVADDALHQAAAGDGVDRRGAHDDELLRPAAVVPGDRGALRGRGALGGLLGGAWPARRPAPSPAASACALANSSAFCLAAAFRAACSAAACWAAGWAACCCACLLGGSRRGGLLSRLLSRLLLLLLLLVGAVAGPVVAVAVAVVRCGGCLRADGGDAGCGGGDTSGHDDRRRRDERARDQEPPAPPVHATPLRPGAA